MSEWLPWMAPWSGWTVELLILLIGLAVAWRGLFHDRSRGGPRCPRCWYDRTGLTSAICPECGHAIRSERDAFRTRRHWRFACAGLVLSVALPSLVAQHRIRQYGWDYYLRVGPLYWAMPDQTILARDVAGYRIEVLRDRRANWNGARRNNPLLRIRRRGRTEMQLTRGWRWEIGYAPEGSAAPPIPPGRDLNGDGIPDVVLLDYSGGAHCCFTLYIVELGKKAPQLLAAIDAEHGEPELTDLDHDGRIDIVLYDWTFAYWNASFAGSPAPTVVLSWDGTRYVPNCALMRRPAPDAAHLWQQAQKVKAHLLTAGPGEAGLDEHSDLWKPMLDLIYTGHPAEAREFLDDAWPVQRPGKAEFLADFQAQLARSPYADALVRAASTQPPGRRPTLQSPTKSAINSRRW